MIDTIFYNARFINSVHAAFEREEPPIEAIAVTDGKITHTGSWSHLKRLAHAGTQFVDAGGKTVMPGFFDAHVHIWKVGDLLTQNLDLRGLTSIATLQEKLRAFAHKNPQATWIRARGFNEVLFDEPRLPSAADIDAAVSDRPVFLQRTCAHIAVINTKALTLCQIDEDTPNPYGGIVEKDAHGAPTGRLYETAMGLATRHFPPLTRQDYEQMILAGCRELLKNGITCATDPAVHPELLEAYRALEKEKKLPIRVCAIPILLAEGKEKPYPIPEKYHSPFLRIDTVKFFADGGLSGKTAALNRPYKNDTSQGIMRLQPEHFLNLAVKAQEAGFAIATHAIGDQAIEMVLQVYEKLHTRYPQAIRRIEHFGLATAASIKKCKELGIHIVSQPVFLRELGKNFRDYLDEAYLKICYPYRSVLNAGVNLSFSTDAPVVKNLSPLSCMADAVERKDAAGNEIAPEEKISAAEALYGYTMGSARASGMEAFYGSLHVGKYADWVILADGDWDKAETLRNGSVSEVWIAGAPVFKNPDGAST